jgi:Ca-activated chloride channel homolog
MKHIFTSLFYAILLFTLVASARAQSPELPEPPPVPPVLKEAVRANEEARIKAAEEAARKAAEEKAKEENPEIDENDVLHVSTSLITVPAEVMDRNGRYIGNLQKSDFRIFENGKEHEVAYFASVEQPFTVALLLDVSGSTVSQMQAIRTAANAFIKKLRPIDRLLVISFDGKINVITEAITVAELRKKRLRLDALNDGTLLHDALSFALKQRLTGIKGRKAIVLLTDGVDTGSKQASIKQNLRDAEESDVIIYPVQYNTLPQLPERLARIVDPKARQKMTEKITKEYRIGSDYLRALSEKTGGRLYNAETLADVPQVFGAITDELGRQYSLGYYPTTQAGSGERRDIKVRVRTPGLVVRARQSYVATASNSR